MNFIDLPDDILANIFAFNRKNDLIKLLSLSVDYQTRILENQDKLDTLHSFDTTSWKDAYIKRWGDPNIFRRNIITGNWMMHYLLTQYKKCFECRRGKHLVFHSVWNIPLCEKCSSFARYNLISESQAARIYLLSKEQYQSIAFYCGKALWSDAKQLSYNTNASLLQKKINTISVLETMNIKWNDSMNGYLNGKDDSIELLSRIAMNETEDDCVSEEEE